MKNIALTILTFILSIASVCGQSSDYHKTSLGELKITPVLHGSLTLEINDITIMVDPYGGAQKYTSFSKPNMILITDIHGDHLNQKTLDGITTEKAEFIVPAAVKEQLATEYNTTVLNNGQGIHRKGIFIEAFPMYNLPISENSRHPKGRGNGYILTFGDTVVYISGDTEDIPEMRMLRNIDIAFVCMNLPYTMDIYQASSAVLEFQPKIVYPFHYRGKEGLSDINEFKNLVEKQNSTIDVRLKNWYPED